MKKLILGAVTIAAVALPALPAAAATFTVTGSVTASCSAVTNSTIAFSSIGLQADGTLTASQTASSSAQANFYCNGAGTTLTLAHTAMTNGVTAPSGFTSTIDFTPAVKIGATDKQVGDGTGIAFGAQAGSLTMDARSLTAAAKPTAGSYSGSITLTLTPSS